MPLLGTRSNTFGQGDGEEFHARPRRLSGRNQQTIEDSETEETDVEQPTISRRRRSEGSDGNGARTEEEISSELGTSHLVDENLWLGFGTPLHGPFGHLANDRSLRERHNENSRNTIEDSLTKSLDPNEEIIIRRGRRKMPTTPVRQSPRFHSPTSPEDAVIMEDSGMHSPPPAPRHDGERPYGPSPFTKCLRSMGRANVSNIDIVRHSKRQLFPTSPESESKSASKTIKIERVNQYSPTSRVLRSADVKTDDSGYLSTSVSSNSSIASISSVASTSSGASTSSVSQQKKTRRPRNLDNVRKRLNFRRL